MVGVADHEDEVVGKLDSGVAPRGGVAVGDLVGGGEAGGAPGAVEEVEAEARPFGAAQLQKGSLHPVAVTHPGAVVGIAQGAGVDGPGPDVAAHETEQGVEQVVGALVAGGEGGLRAPGGPLGLGVFEKLGQILQGGFGLAEVLGQLGGVLDGDDEERGGGLFAGAEAAHDGLHGFVALEETRIG